MPITFEKRIDLTDYEGNPEPHIVEQLSIIHESSDGEIVQYYIKPRNQTQGDKNSYAIGVYDKDSKTWSYHDFDELVWNKPGQRISGNRIERLGIKAFPGMGACAFYKLAHRKITRLVIPVNRKKAENAAPSLDAVVNADGTVSFTITPPKKPEYECYRIVMDYDIYSEEYITYDLELTVPKPGISGEYRCYAVGYGEEGQLYSMESNVIVLTLDGRERSFMAPFYSRSDIDRMTALQNLSFTGHQSALYNGKQSVSVEIPKQKGAVLYGIEEPGEDIGIDGSVYVQYQVAEETPVVVAEWIRLQGLWIKKN